ncbi:MULTISPECIES: endonuclease MutS2 [Bacillus]|uniref:Endonuclease MutS2 n=1 Tax=Bacillus glycinifermentans TaxID=1664069 RepID=A0AAJ3Z371_9BACI|nr:MULTISPECIES: endonuclease MutS2 [Bacillus]KKB72634.1 recombination and DNA strand exchange inhibitor protein [Bacillus sp. TH008]MDU0070103.1 endonuclease MutS2 [Bacillus sp. IG6]MED8017776.1 endonuclease MutS2 [Bacillus glycinifermentans]QAT67928.1 endonuclease MutS2 [Bacillus glycinifermentans]WKB79734.1 endonuclease MutS2 [Bacillus glycinifermentans]
MQQKALSALEFHKVKEQLAEHAASSLGKEMLFDLKPSRSFEEVKKLLEEVDEAGTVLRLKGSAPFGGLSDIRKAVRRAEIGSILSPAEFTEISGLLYAAKQMKHFLEGLFEDGVEIPHLHQYAEQLIPLSDLEKDINSCIDDHGEVLDHASETLRGIRTQLRTLESRIRDRLEAMLRSSSAQKMLSDTIITIRNDRFVIPVKQEYRSSYGGIVHDQSSSGATLFIEPQVIVDMNNSLRQAKVNEKQEIERILRVLTEKTAEHTDELLHNVKILQTLDFIFAKAKYAKATKAVKPAVNRDGYVRFIRARHPLLPADQVVPNDIELGGDYTTIVITGPNTGGKTVTLKTLGLLTLMAQSGLHVPAEEGSETAVFDQVFADIGDEQSIEQSLSTFSSHMVNIVDILKDMTPNSLVLFDELGAGTDPQEGAALAISILDEVCQTGARVIATTHYPELKAYGYNRENVINASVEFDIETLSPTYKLLIGVPGRSNAFEISKRLGLPERLISRAKAEMTAEHNEVDTMIASLEDSKKRAETELAETEAIRAEAEALHRDLKKQISEWQEKKDRLYEEAEQKAAEKVKEAMKEADDIIQSLRMIKDEQKTFKDHELIEAKKRLEEAVPSFEKTKKPVQKKTDKRTLKPGDEVKVLTFGQKGTLLEKTGADEWNVQIGILKMKVKEKDLEFLKSAPEPEKQQSIAKVKGKDYHVSLELDLRGERYESALHRVEKYLDDAVLAGYPRVSIIHGKGTGALRKGVQDLLKNHRSVKNSRFGEAGEGGSGVTIVELK